MNTTPPLPDGRHIAAADTPEGFPPGALPPWPVVSSPPVRRIRTAMVLVVAAVAFIGGCSGLAATVLYRELTPKFDLANTYLAQLAEGNIDGAAQLSCPDGPAPPQVVEQLDAVSWDGTFYLDYVTAHDTVIVVGGRLGADNGVVIGFGHPLCVREVIVMSEPPQ